MIINLTLSDQAHPKYTRISEVGMALSALLSAYSNFDDEIAKTEDTERIVYLRFEQEKTGEVFQRLMDIIDVAKEGWGQ